MVRQPASSEGFRRALPAITPDAQPYWTGGSRSELLIFQCMDCSYYVHPPTRFCPRCESRKVEPTPVSGRGHVITYTINHKRWVPEITSDFVLALVAIDEQTDVQLPCNIVNIDPDKVEIGMRVKVLFEEAEDLWVPLFEPVRGE